MARYSETAPQLSIVIRGEQSNQVRFTAVYLKTACKRPTNNSEHVKRTSRSVKSQLVCHVIKPPRSYLEDNKRLFDTGRNLLQDKENKARKLTSTEIE
ncbi:hypothetical protein FGIG_00234 [Fasciola gigantica]|uniref:Uncharacterized protein n=1 Tax=Fasciola gigantica TaxID=46835 RepID=A0A504YUC8_FASGI|nr:hypothetical protein FGIG_00234 [Fasciola gigantica]